MKADLKNKIVIVLGPHRSGTSLCAAAVSSLGVELGFSDVYKNEDNKKGFFEHPDVVSLNDRLLHEMNSTWDDPRLLKETDFDFLGIEKFNHEAKCIIENSFLNHSFSVLKDPRLCQLLPFWINSFKSLGYTDDSFYFIHVVRDPVEVAISHSRRAIKNPGFYEYGRRLEEGAALWLSSTIQSLANSKKYPGLFISYRSLLEKSAQELGRISKYLSLSVSKGQIEHFSSDFVDVSLYRSKTENSAVEQVKVHLPVVFSVYKYLTDISEYDASYVNESILSVMNDKNVLLNFYSSQLASIPRLSYVFRSNSSKVKRLNEELVYYKKQVEDIKCELDRQKEILSHVYLSQIDEIKKDSDNKISSLNGELDTLRFELEKQNGIYELELEKQAADYTANKNSEISDWKSMVSELEAELSAQNIRFTDELKKQKSIYEAMIDEGGNSFSNEVERIRSDTLEEYVKQNNMYKAMLSEQENSFIEEVERIKNDTAEEFIKQKNIYEALLKEQAQSFLDEIERIKKDN